MKKAQFTNFGLRQFIAENTGTKLKIKDIDAILEAINTQLNEYYLESKLGSFCIYVPILNTFDVKSPIADIKRIKKRWISSKYVARQDGELPVLVRNAEVPFWFKEKPAKFLVAVLYSREQLLSEHNAQKNKNPLDVFELSNTTDYGIVTILASENQLPDPMPPITMMRNALGKKEGGNGVKLDHQQYLESVDFWQNHILFRKSKKVF